MVHEHDHECGCGHHHHDEDTEHLHTNKYQQAFAKFEAAGTTEEVTGRVKTLLGKHGNDNFTPDVLKQIHGFIDLTSLTSIDTRPQIDGKFVRSAKISLASPKLPRAIAWMKRGISFSIGQPIRHKGFGQFRQRFASASASSIV